MYVARDLWGDATLIDRALVLNSNLAEAWSIWRLGKKLARRTGSGDRALRASYAPEPVIHGGT